MKKNIIWILSILLIGSLIFVNNAVSEDLPEDSLENNQISMDPNFEVIVPDSNEDFQDEINPALEPEGDPDYDNLFKEELPGSEELEDENSIASESGKIIE